MKKQNISKLKIVAVLVSVVLLGLLFVIYFASDLAREVEGRKNVERCRLLKVGMTRSQVRGIMKATPMSMHAEENITETWYFEGPHAASTAPHVIFDKQTGKAIKIICDDSGIQVLEKKDDIKSKSEESIPEGKKYGNVTPIKKELENEILKQLNKSAFIVETNILTQTPKARALVAWMIDPEKVPLMTENAYTCPEYSRGNHYSGPLRISLLDLTTLKIINTLDVINGRGKDKFDLPYRIKGNNWENYHNPDLSAWYKISKKPFTEEEWDNPPIMWLKDYNGDGKLLEFGLFDQIACMGIYTCCIGYSEKQDNVIFYKVDDKDWADYLFREKQKRPGEWEFEVDYRGRGGGLAKTKVKYNKEKECFETVK
ncbi:MAG: hypothetical protein A2452_04395 [Candidatus Firestonebacteria bacterium RIFOXYC2_FULL_39_67]|nr:MAG: hypothetical protein A2536_04130 [Candidatus Firestonebacteria bacterium RIFOXYD2_FULL_39_29]OGF56830.1 MAG: hypothetical protein A2452_04395 [Candidatus Firestonebacteria bacterium RIFOXYC2_FULL_39_67]